MRSIQEEVRENVFFGTIRWIFSSLSIYIKMRSRLRVSLTWNVTDNIRHAKELICMQKNILEGFCQILIISSNTDYTKVSIEA